MRLTLTKYSKHIFLHIPKTAGTTLTTIINRNYAGGAIKTLYVPDSFGSDLAEGLNDLNTKMLYGHFAYDNILNNSKYYVFTFLREPVSRTISNFIHLKNSAEIQHQEWMKDVRTLEDFLSKKQSFNWQARHLSGQKFHADFGKDLDYSLQLAKTNLNRMNLVGITELFEDSLLCLSKDLGWKKLRFSRENVQQKAKEEAKQLYETYYDAVAEQNQLDLILYRIATENLAKRMAGVNDIDRIKFTLNKLR